MSKKHLTLVIKKTLKIEALVSAIMAAGYRLPMAKKIKGVPPPVVRFVCNGDGTITDNLTGLIWIKDPSTLGDVWGNPGDPSRMTWQKAIDNCKKLNFAGHKDWKLPTIKELQSLIDYEKSNPAINTEFFPNTQSSWYWSATPVVGCSDSAWFVGFYGGGVYYDRKDDGDYVRPVRSRQ